MFFRKPKATKNQEPPIEYATTYDTHCANCGVFMGHLPWQRSLCATCNFMTRQDTIAPPTAFGLCSRCGHDCILLAGLCYACERKA